MFCFVVAGSFQGTDCALFKIPGILSWNQGMVWLGRDLNPVFIPTPMRCCSKRGAWNKTSLKNPIFLLFPPKLGRVFEGLPGELREKAGGAHQNPADGAEVGADPGTAPRGCSFQGPGDHVPGCPLRVHPGLAGAAAGQDQGGQVRNSQLQRQGAAPAPSLAAEK